MGHTLARRPSGQGTKLHIIDTSATLYCPYCGQDGWEFAPDDVSTTTIGTDELLQKMEEGDICKRCFTQYRRRGFGDTSLLKADVQRVAGRVGRPPSTDEYAVYGHFSTTIVTEELNADSWGDVLSIADVY